MSPTNLPRLGLLLAGLLLTACDSAPSFSRGNPEATAKVEQAQSRSAAGDNDSAYALLDRAKSNFPRSFEVAAEYAACAARTERSALAIETWKQLIASLPEGDERDAFSRSLAHTSLIDGFLEHAREPIAQLCSRPKPRAFDLDLAARLDFEEGRLTSAISWSQRATKLAPNDPRLAYQLARALSAAGAPGANAALVRTLELDPGQSQARFSLGTLLLQAGDLEAGNEVLSMRATVQTLGSREFAGFPPKRRIDRARTAAQELPTWSKPMLLIARAQLELGQPKKAQVSLKLAAKLAPKSLEHSELNIAAALALGHSQESQHWTKIWQQQRERGIQ